MSATFPKLTDVQIEWETDRFDGPIHGVASREGRHYWFAAVFDKAADEYLYPRRLLLYELSMADLRNETERHRRFEELVGTHSCWHLPAEQRRLKESTQWDEFYEWSSRQRKPDLRRSAPIGWFSPDRPRPP
ncbi:MAG: hypothetical protein E6J13_00815 [Chloroflexi bacterium]|nr:MAG: hypothetical protein E6J13_00815 [Chloroflexota bacterium]